MSWLHCDACDALIDTDDDPGAYDERRDQWLCVDCRGPETPERDPGEAEDAELEITAKQGRIMAREAKSVHWQTFHSRPVK